MFNIDYKDISIIDSLPTWSHEKVVLNIGCGPADLDCYLAHLGYRVYCTDMYKQKEWDNQDKKEWIDKGLMSFHEGVNILDPSTLPIKNAAIVICSEVIEHLTEYKKAFENLLNATDTRLIITFPWRRSFYVGSNSCMKEWESHKNFWSDNDSPDYKDVREFVPLADPYAIAISKNVTKDADWQRGQRSYLVVVNKRFKKV